MATNYPISQDNNSTLPSPTGSTQMNAGAVPHAELHDNVNDAIKAIEAKVGYTASTPAGASIFVSDASNNTTWSNLYGDVSSQGTYTTLATTGVSAGTYSNANITVDSKGRVVSAVSGATGGNSPLAFKGDVYTFSTQPTRLPVGTDGQVLSADSTQTTGLKWVTGGGTVTSVSVVSANGLAGTVANATSTPAITLSSSVNGIVKGNGTTLSAATSGTDYSAGTSGLTTGILKSTTATGVLTIAVAGDFPTLNQNTTGTASNVTGTVVVANGGTGATTLTGIVKGNGTSAMTTVTAPSGAIVGTTDTQTLTNKTLTSPIVSSISNTGTLTLPTSSDTLVGRATTDTLTNKTIDATANTVSNVSSLSINRQSITTNSVLNGVKIQAGWGYIQGTGNSFASKTVTLPTAFTTDYIVVISQGGYKDTSAPTTIYDTTGAYEVPTIASRPLTTSTFTAIFNSPGTTVATTRYILFHWTAIGN